MLSAVPTKKTTCVPHCFILQVKVIFSTVNSMCSRKAGNGHISKLFLTDCDPEQS